MHVGFQQLAVIAYILLLALGPRRVVRWVRWSQDLGARLRGRPPPPRPKWDLLRVVERFEYSSPVGWAVAALGFGLVLVPYFAASLGISAQLVPLLYVGATALLFLALLLI